MRKTYKHTHDQKNIRRNPLKRVLLQSAISFVLLIGVFLMSDKIASFKDYVKDTLNKSYTVSDVKEIKDKTVESAEEIKEAVAVFKEQNKKTEEKPPKDKKIIFTPPYIGEITSVYGERIHPIDKSRSFHTGIDIAGNIGDTIISAAPGKVEKVGYDKYNGHYVSIRHNEKYSTSYAHMLKVSVIEGEEVDSNTKIGEIGSTGVSTGAHLHFCIFEDGETIDPEIYVKLNHR
ncbi:MAG: M23 family metallopeptidase [Ruminococcaceae bacterium]|nr:M23 family metallopeptidase [Oscillospiraceae bacterium]